MIVSQGSVAQHVAHRTLKFDYFTVRTSPLSTSARGVAGVGWEGGRTMLRWKVVCK